MQKSRSTASAQFLVLLHDGLGYQLQLFQFNLLQQHQHPAYLPVTPQHFLYRDFMMASSPSEDCASAVVNQNGTTSDAMSYAMDQLDTLNMAKVTVECYVCNLKFNTRSVLDCHMAGLKHQKKLKSLELLKSLEPMQSEFERDDVSGVIRCIVCNITVNSPQLLATHMAGNKHKAKAASASKRPLKQEADGAPPAKRACNTSQDNASDSAFIEARDEQTTGAEGNQQAAASGGGSNKKKKKKKSLGLPGTTEGSIPVEEPIDLPDCVTKLVTSSGGTSGYYLCNPCNAHCNSPQQLTQHLTSKKHLDKLRGDVRPTGRGTDAGRGGGMGWGHNKGRGVYAGSKAAFIKQSNARGGRGGRGRGVSSYGMAMKGKEEFMGGYRGGRGRGARGGGMRGRGEFVEGGHGGMEGGFRGNTSFRGRGFSRGGGSMHFGDEGESYGDGGDGWYGNEAPAQAPLHYGSRGRGRGNPALGEATGEEDFLSWQARTQTPGVGQGRTTSYGGGRGGYGGREEGYGERKPAFGGREPAFGGRESAFGGKEPAFGGKEPAFGGKEPAFGGKEPAFGGREPTFGGGDHRVGYGGRGSGFGAQEGAFGTGGGRGGFKANGKSVPAAVNTYPSEGPEYGGNQRYGAGQYAGASEVGTGRGGGAVARGGGFSNSSYKRPAAPAYETGGAEADKFYKHWSQPPPPPPVAAKGLYDLPGAGSSAAARPYVGGYPQQQDAAGSHSAMYGGHQASHTFTEPLSENFVYGNIMT